MAIFNRVLLTGGAGFVGRLMGCALTEAYPEARRVLLYHSNQKVPVSGFEQAIANVTDSSAVDAIIADLRPDLVVHLAAQSSVGQAVGATETTWRTNFCGSLEIASAVARHAPESTFFFTSSAEVYGASFRDGPTTEDTPLRPMNAYARSKAAAEAMLADVLDQRSRLIIARSFNHAGAGQDARFVLASFAQQIAEIETGLREPRLHVGNLDAQRDFLDVRDVINAYILLLEKSEQLSPRSIFNIASGKAWPISELLDKLRKQSWHSFEVVKDPTRLRPSEIPTVIGDSARLRAATDWVPVHQIDETLRWILDGWRAQIGQIQ